MAQKTLLQIAQAVTAELGFPTPQIVVSSADTNVAKLLALIRATCDDLLHEHDWQELQKRYTFATTNGVDNYALPSDEERFMSASFYDQNNRWPMLGPLTAVEWEQIKVGNLSTSPFERYRVMGDKLYLSPTPGANTSTFVYEYISNAYCTSSAGVPQTDLQQDSDIIVFDHRAVVYGVKAKWLASVNMDTAKADEDYARALEHAKSTNEPARRLSITGAGVGIPLLSTLNIPDTGFGGAY